MTEDETSSVWKRHISECILISLLTWAEQRLHSFTCSQKGYDSGMILLHTSSYGDSIGNSSVTQATHATQDNVASLLSWAKIGNLYRTNFSPCFLF